ncbi:TPA: hypothetical protein PPD39_001872 [Acinetobacter baumannii]|nr:hypothetical protein [Acinetobacter baumannii]
MLRVLFFVCVFLSSVIVSETRAQPPMPPQIGFDPIFGPICMGPFGPGRCQDIERFIQINYVADGIQLQQIGFNPFFGPICSGPLGPGPCRQIQIYIAIRQIALQQVKLPIVGSGQTCLGPLGVGPCEAIRAYLMQTQSAMNQLPSGFNVQQPQILKLSKSNGEPMCQSPFGPVPCSLFAQIGLDLMGSNQLTPNNFIQTNISNVQKRAKECAKQVGVDVAAFSACTGQNVILSRQQQAVLDCAVAAKSTEAFASCAAPQLGYALSNDQQKIAGCAVKSQGNEQIFKTCMGGIFLDKILSQDERKILQCANNNPDPVSFGKCAAQKFISNTQRAMLDCAISSDNINSFASCSLPYTQLKMSEEQRVLVKCAMQTQGNKDDFAVCAGNLFLNNGLGDNERKVLSCAASAAGNESNFAACSANILFGNNLSKEQQIAVQCAAQSQGDPIGFASCAGANMFNMQLNAEQQIAVQCVVSTGGQPQAAAGCIASRLTARELSKCLSGSVGGEDGCFGDNNDLIGKNGWVARTFGQIMGQPFLMNPDLIWGGDNSFVRNPGQIFGGDNSFVRNPGQIFGGNNSVFNNPGQLLPQPKPVQLGSIGGKRICLPWC